MNNSLTALSGVRVGHATHLDKLTGCTFILFDKDRPVSYKAYGGAPGTFNTDLLRSGMTYYRRHGLFVTGGSLSGLASAGTIMQSMVRNKIGFSESESVINPSISGAVVFDLGMRVTQFDPAYGEEAFSNLSSDPVTAGNVGAGTGTSCGWFSYTAGGKFLCMKGGIGNARIDLGNGVIVAAMTVLNAMGNVVTRDGKILAGNRHDSHEAPFRTFENSSLFLSGSKTNTTVSIVGINVDLGSLENYEKIAHQSSLGQARAIYPSNTTTDGDTVFVFSTEEIKDFLTPLGHQITQEGWPQLRLDIIGNAAASAVQESIYDACRAAETIQFADACDGIIPAARDYRRNF